MKPRILIIGANGQIGTDLGHALAARYGADAVVVSDIAAPPAALPAGMMHHILDATDADALQRLVDQQGITQIYLLAAALSARGEQHPLQAGHDCANRLPDKSKARFKSLLRAEKGTYGSAVVT